MGSTMMKKKKMYLMYVVAVVLVSMGKRAAAEVHHVVGNDQGWAAATDLDSWISGRVFKIGDTLWFAYSTATESIMEVQTLEDFLSCELTNPIRIYNKGLDKVLLDTQGTRYFTSANLESCKKGLKIPVNVTVQLQFPNDHHSHSHSHSHSHMSTLPLPISNTLALAPETPPTGAAPHHSHPTPTGLSFAFLFGLLLLLLSSMPI